MENTINIRASLPVKQYVVKRAEELDMSVSEFVRMLIHTDMVKSKLQKEGVI